MKKRRLYGHPKTENYLQSNLVFFARLEHFEPFETNINLPPPILYSSALNLIKWHAKALNCNYLLSGCSLCFPASPLKKIPLYSDWSCRVLRILSASTNLHQVSLAPTITTPLFFGSLMAVCVTRYCHR